MIRLALTFMRGSGWARIALIAGPTALASALLMIAVAIVQLPENPDESLFNLVGEQGLRPGTVFAMVVLTVPLMLLLYQAVRLGTAARERRLAALRVAGATPSEVRRLGAFEVGVPVLAGAIAGLPLFGLFRVMFGGTRYDEVDGWFAYTTGDSVVVSDGFTTPNMALVPTTVAPSWWQFLLIITVMTAVGVFVGGRASRRVVITPLGVTRRQALPPPRPWGLLPVATAGAVFAVRIVGPVPRESLTAIGLAALVVIGVVMLAPWFAYKIGVRIAARTDSPVNLLAARQLVADPRPAGRAAAAVGAIGLVAGGAAGTAADLSSMSGWDSFFVVSFALVGVAMLVALVVATSAMAVHAIESLLDRRRALAALVAAGTDPEVIHAAQRRAAVLVAVPLAAGGAFAGLVATAAIGLSTPALLVYGLLGIAAVTGLTWVAAYLAAGIVKPWMLKATAPGNLRTE